MQHLDGLYVGFIKEEFLVPAHGEVSFWKCGIYNKSLVFCNWKGIHYVEGYKFYSRVYFILQIERRERWILHTQKNKYALYLF